MFLQIMKAVGISVLIPPAAMLLLVLGERAGILPPAVGAYVREHLFLILVVVLVAMVLPLLRKALRGQ